MANFTGFITRLRQEKFPFRFVVSRLLLRGGIDLPIAITFWEQPLIKTYLHASSAAHKLFIGKYKPDLDIAVFTAYAKHGAVVVDVGANIGMYAVLAGRLSGETGRVFAFEPTRRTYKYLVENIKLNSATNVLPIHAAVTDQDGEVSFTEHSYSHEQNHISVANERGARVKAVRLDTFLKDADVASVDFLKVDVEGAELPVMRSLGDLLSHTKTVYLEFHAGNYDRFGYTKADMFEFLKAKGFDIYDPSLKERALFLEPVEDADTIEGRNILAIRHI